MRKILLALLGTMLATSVCFAAQEVRTIIDTTILSSTVTAARGTAYIGDSEKTAFYVFYDETQVDKILSAVVTIDTSVDNTNWTTASFRDYNGSSVSETLQTAETIGVDGTYFCWFDEDLTLPYVRMNIAGTNLDTDDVITVKAYLVEKK